MSPLALVPNNVWAARPDRASDELAIKAFLSRFRRLSHQLALLVLALALLILAAALPQASQAAPGAWSLTGNLSTARAYHTATLLPNGKVLVAGGSIDAPPPFDVLASAELYDLASGSWSASASPMSGLGRKGHTATLLPNGKVLMAGGYDGIDYLADAELYDPTSKTFTPTGSMSDGRAYHTATLLPNGKVLVAGGEILVDPWFLGSAELYDPDSGTWSSAGSMGTERSDHTATLLPNGKVLVAGGWNNPSGQLADAEVYDPFPNTWSPTNPLPTKLIGHSATLLLNGKVLVAGGIFGFYSVTSANFYDPITETWSATGSLGASRGHHSATMLTNGQVLVSGGVTVNALNPDPVVYLASAELYDPASGTWSATGPLLGARDIHLSTRLDNGKVLVTGGENPVDNFLITAEVYDPAPPPLVKLPALLAFYPFNGNARDASGNSRHGTVNGSPQLVPGYQGQAYSFNPTPFIISPDYITVPLDINPSNYPKLTMGAWAKPMDIGWIAALLTHDDGEYDRQVGLDTRGGGIGWSAFCGPTGQVLGAVPAILGKWTFVAVVYDQVAQTVKLQVDDMVLARTWTTLGPGQNQLFIGGSPQYNQFLSGFIDNVFVFGDALTDQQLAYIRTRGAPAFLKPNPGLLLLLLND